MKKNPLPETCLSANPIGTYQPEKAQFPASQRHWDRKVGGWPVLATRFMRIGFPR
jgi:hypothetical protein